MRKPAHPLLLGLFFAGIFSVIMYLSMRWHFLNDTGIINTESTKQHHKVYVKRNLVNFYYVKGIINGVEIDFLVDTGASRVTIPASLAVKAGLTSQAARQIATVNGNIHANETTIPALSIGPIILLNVEAFIVPDSDPIPLLGMSALKDLMLLQKEGFLLMAQPRP